MGRTSVDQIDAYGRTTAHTDLGGHTFVYSFNYAGWLTGQTGSTGQNISYTYYANGYVESIRDIALNTESHYEYDEAGNRKYESYSRTVNGVTEYLENAAIDYDAANRVTRIHDTRADITYEYDAVGNRRRVRSVYHDGVRVTRIHDTRADITYEYDAVGNRRRVRSVYHDGVQGSMQIQDFWYDYDNMNRFTVTMGRLSGAAALSAGDTSIKVVLGVAGSEGVRLQYNKAGQRIQAVYARDNHREDYKYGVEGYLEDTYINANDSMQGALASKRVNDLLGRTTNYYEYNTQGGMTYERSTVYSADGRQLSQSGTDGTVTYQYYSELVNGADSVTKVSASGAGELAIVTTTTKDGTVITNYTAYDYWDEAKQRSLTVKGETAYKPDTAWRPGVSSMAYDVNGHLKAATDAGADGKMGTAELDKDNVTFSYISNAQGLVLRREQYTGDKVGMMHRYLYLNGAMVGDVGNDGDARLDYAQSLGQAKASREEMYKNWTPISSADFDQNYQPINRTYPAATGSTYVVKAGDSLYAIAGAVWGDVSMWYLIAEANGITAETPLTPNQTLTIPNKVTNIHNNSGTSRPYDAGAIIGDLSPTLPDAPLPAPPPQKSGGGCGGLGMIIMAVIAVVVTVYAGPAIGQAIYAAAGGGAVGAGGLAAVGTLGATAAGAAGMAAGAALGSIASQMAGVAMGMQDKINWRAVGSSALTGGLTFGAGAGLSALGANQVVTAVANNIIGQGVGKMMGTQEHFSWKSVAVSAISAPIMSAVKGGIGKELAGAPASVVSLAQNSTSALVSATVRMVVTGGRISWAAVAADAVSSTIGDSIEASRRDQLRIKNKPSSATGSGGKQLSPEEQRQLDVAIASEKRKPKDDLTASTNGGIPSTVEVAGSRSLRHSDGKGTYLSVQTTDEKTVWNYTDGYVTEDGNAGTKEFTRADMSGLGANLSQEDYAYASKRLYNLSANYDALGLWHDVKAEVGSWFGATPSPVRTPAMEQERWELRQITANYAGAHPEVWQATSDAVDAARGGVFGAAAVLMTKDSSVVDRQFALRSASILDQGLNGAASMRLAKQNAPVLPRNAQLGAPSSQSITIGNSKTNPASASPTGNYAPPKVAPAGVTYNINTQKPAAPQSGSRAFWTNRTQFEGTRVYQRADAFDPNQMTSWRQGGKVVTGTNLERMATGRAPIGTDGKSVNLHHMTQANDSPIAEMTQTFHQKNSKIIHINPNTIPSGIDRNAFDAWKSRYWTDRANNFGN
ncbi:HNH/ENDO VII family nuclease [Massilia sp. Leaf139]|uniref:HNH/ENDO VII family nuclease n=1 Tax=Massilia sp. Leaf139 TaxID=1736272 RepID=UPI001E29A667|nr:HNH/ENDO VII family nuclease [Massilia sp. Leaf139]